MFDETVLCAFHDELQKSAAIPWKSLGGNVGALGGAGAAIGALAGAGHGAVKKYREARDQGAGVGGALLHGGAGALGGALPGAALGAVAGGSLGALGTHLAPELTARAARGALDTHYLGAAARSGQRQVHGLTGWAPEGGIESIRGGAYGARASLDAAKASGDVGRIAGAERSLARAKEVQGRGMTSLPGIAHALKEDPKGALRAGAMEQVEQMRGASLPWKALMVGVPAAQLGGALFGKEDPEHGRGERLGRAAGGMAGMALLGGAPMGAQMLGQGLMDAGGGGAGRLIDKIRARAQGKQHPGYLTHPSEQQSEGQHAPTERVMSDAAQGRAPEGMMG